MGRNTWLKGYGSFLAAACGMAGSTPATAQPGPAASDAVLRVVDVGAGLCVVIVVPGGNAMLYDAGRGGDTCRNVVREMVPSGRLDLIVLSHSDADHIRDMRDILADNRVAAIIHPGDPRGPTVDTMRTAINAEGAAVWNLADAATPPAPGRRFSIGSGSATFVAGWSNGNDTRGLGEPSLPSGPRNNALSIVIRFEYGGHSVLLTGDTVGRLDFAPPATCQFAERIMVERAPTVPIKSDVLVGQHHGADNATSNCFAAAVDPDFVVFSAGNEYHHPRQSAVDRLTGNGVALANIFRTDLGDNEGGTGRNAEMSAGSGRCADRPGDDDVEIRLPRSPTARVTVRYRGASRGCP